MPRNPFGWSLPPGVTQRHIDEAIGDDDDYHCDICGLFSDECECDIICLCSEPEDEGDGQCKLCGKEIR